MFHPWLRDRQSLCISLFVCLFITGCSGDSSRSDADDVSFSNRSGVSPDLIWTLVEEPNLPADYSAPTEFVAAMIDWEKLQEQLDLAPNEINRAPSSSSEITLPMPDGSFQFFSILRTQMMEKALVDLFPQIQTFRMDSIRPPNTGGHLTIGIEKLYATGQSEDGMLRIDPLMTDDGLLFISYFDRNRTDRLNDFVHVMNEQTESTTPSSVPRSTLGVLQKLTYNTAARQAVVAAKESTGDTLRTFRFTATTTGEFYQANDGGNGDVDVLLSLIQRINAVNAVFEVEVGVRLILAANTLTVLFNDPVTDGLNDGDTPCNLRDANRELAKIVLNDADYDIGFLFSTGSSGGCAWYVTCLTSSDTLHKARGAGHFSANGLGMGTGLILHETGHQLGAKHTYSGQASGCNLANFDGDDATLPSAFAPGSGSSIMSYSGSCGTDNVDLNLIGSGQYFHAMSFEQIVENITTGSGSVCASPINTGNTEPTVSAGSDYTIPQDTPFTLEGSGNDDEPLIFNWEQIDLATTQRAIDTDDGIGPIIRSVPPVSSANRTIPDIRDLLANMNRAGELLPQVDRTVNMRLTARDMQAGGGGVNSDDMVITVSGDPFEITSPNSGNLPAGCEVPVTWDIGGGAIANNVDISYSGSGGLNGDQESFPESIVLGTANDGSHNIMVPCGDTSGGRIKVAASDNIFFDVNDNNLTVLNEKPVSDVAPMNDGEVDDQCEFLVNFSAEVTDSCGIQASDVEVILNKIAPGSYTLGPPTINIAQNGVGQVDVSGHVLVSDLTASPVILKVEVKGTDNCGTIGIGFSSLEIADTTPPEIDVSVTPDSLWPPNHKMRPIEASVTVTDNCPITSFVLTEITSNEDDNGKGIGDGNTEEDIQNADFGTEDIEFDLRAERAGGKDGRVYTITYSVTDGADNTADDSATVTVLHDQN